MKDEVDSLLVDKSQKFLQSDTIFLDVWPGIPKNTQNNKFAIFLRYLKKELSDKVDFLHADKHENLIQILALIENNTNWYNLHYL